MNMKLTKYPQSCVLIEVKGKKVLIDPGSIDYNDSFLEKWKNADIVLITHKHSDHIYLPAITEILKNPNVKLFTTMEVLKKYDSLRPELVKAGDILQFEGFKIEVVKAVHGYMPFLKGGNEIYENVGYIVDDGAMRIYHTSDCICFPNDYKCDVILLPITNHGLTMGAYDGAAYAKEVGAKVVIPVHYDNKKFNIDIESVKKVFDEQRLRYKFLNHEETVGFEH